MRIQDIMPRIDVKPQTDATKSRDFIQASGVHHFPRDAILQACVAYFRHVHSSDKIMHPTPFHQALIKNDKAFFYDVTEKLSAELKAFVLSTPVTWDTSGKLDILQHFMDTVQILLEPNCAQVAPSQMVTEILQQRSEDCMQQEKRRIELPLSLIAVTGDTEFLTEAIVHGADILAQDSKGNNLFHDIVYFSVDHPDAAIEVFQVLLQCMPDTQMRQDAIRHPNRKGRTPLDLAAQKHSPEIFLAIINAEGIYKITVKDCLFHKHVLYDLSEYESMQCKKVSPMHYFKALTDGDIHRYDKCNFFKSEPISSWLEAINKTVGLSALPVGVVQMVFQCLYWVCASVYMYEHRLPYGLLIPLTTVSFILGTFELFFESGRIKSDIKAIRKFLQTGKIPTTLTIVYRKIYISFLHSCTVFGAFLLFDLRCKYPTETSVLFLLSQNLACLSLLYVIQINKRVGHLLILLLKMLYDTAMFLTVAVIFYFTAVNFFYASKYTPNTCSINDTATLKGSLTQYVSMMYETFLLGLAIKSPSTEFFDDTMAGIQSVFYVGSVVVFTIILVNMLIGIMGRRITEIENHKDTLLKLEKLSIYFYAEFAYNTPMVFKLRIKHRYFKVSDDFSAVYIEVIEKTK